MHKRTKIVVTLGPASSSADVLEKMLHAGVDVVRLNFSHGTHEDHQQRVKLVRDAATRLNKPVGILADLQGPKIRIAKFKDTKVTLTEGSEFILDAGLENGSGTEKVVGIDYKDLPKDVKNNDTLLLDDGRIVLEVKKIKGHKIHCIVKTGGELSNNKGINRLGGGLSANALTDKDKADIVAAVAMNVDYVAVSFPRDASDIEQARELVEHAGGKYVGIIAKIERAEAVTHIDAIISAADGVMVARGDLAVEIGDEEVPAVQKQIIQRARALNRPVITATQMMESMISNPVPTRAEVSDVANAVLDYTDAVMLSAETAAGDFPVQVVKTVARVCCAAERHPSTLISGHRVECTFERIDEAIAMATVYTANHLDIKAIVALTESGTTALLMSRIKTGIPIYAFSRHARTCGKITLYRDTYPINFDVTCLKREQVYPAIIRELRKRDCVNEGDSIIITKGDHAGVHGGTNTMKIIQVT